MPVDPYASGKLQNKKNPYAQKCDVKGKLVVILDGSMDNRALELIAPVSRALRKGEVHELLFTDEEGAKPGANVNRIAYMGFFEVEAAGVIVSGDEVTVNGQLVGHLAGYDETHMPNHQNIIIKTDKMVSGFEQGFPLGAEIVFHKK